MTAAIAQQEFDAAKSQLRVAWLAKEQAEREFRANPARGLAALNAARDAETRAQLTADRALVAVMREESRELIAEARAAMDAAIDRKHAALAAQPKPRGIPNVMHPQMRMFNEDIAATSDALHELELPIVNAEINLRWAEESYKRLCAQREAVDNYCCLDYTERRTDHPRAARQEEVDDMYAARDFTPMVEAMKRGEKHV
jgi:hypothetical protein